MSNKSDAHLIETNKGKFLLSYTLGKIYVHAYDSKRNFFKQVESHNIERDTELIEVVSEEITETIVGNEFEDEWDEVYEVIEPLVARYAFA